jgi:hypothetical protein
VVDLENIVNRKNNLTLRKFTPNTGYNVELVVGTYEFHNIKYETSYVTPSFEAFMRKPILLFTYESFGKLFPNLKPPSYLEMTIKSYFKR